MAKHIGDQLADAMRERSVSQAQLARDFGVKQPSVHEWIKHGRIAKKHLPKLSIYFGKPLSYWLSTDEASAFEVNEERGHYSAAAPPESIESIRRSREVSRIAALTQFATADELAAMADAIEAALRENRRSRERPPV